MAGITQNQQNFLAGEIAVWAQAIEQELKKKLVQKGVEHTGDLIRSLSYKVFSAAGGNSGGFSISFVDYGRFVDMGAGRARLNQTVSSTTKKLKERKPVKWYAKTAYGMIYGPFLGALYRNYSEQIIYTLKELENGKVN